LSVKWATSLLGATNGDTAETWYGNYYAWGEIAEKAECIWANYKYANGDATKLIKYCNKSGYGNDGFTDNLTQLLPEDDVATVTNSVWRMPTKAELEELLTLPNEWVTNYNGVSGLNGQVFTGINGNTLFIPAAGSCGFRGIYNVGYYCNLWSSSINFWDCYRAYYLRINSGNISMNDTDRCDGFSVCPVC
jgi:hypothetical protein